MKPLLDVKNLRVALPTAKGTVNAVRGIDLQINRGEMLCIVGESGCGKSLTSLALMGLLPKKAQVDADVMNFDGMDLRNISFKERSQLRGNRISMIFQEPMTSLNPSYTLGNQLCEAIRLHQGATRQEALDRAVYLLERTGIQNAATRLKQYPHQLSGGLRQRVMIAMALMCKPDLIIADEPTTALDVSIQAQILRLIRELQQETGTAVLFITHDLGVVARIADRVAVMYAGRVIEQAPVGELFANPQHPYTQSLLNCIPVRGKTAPGSHLTAIPGVVPSLIGAVSGCAFANRCSHAFDRCGKTVDSRGAAETHLVHCNLTPQAAQRAMA
ncbi:ABC transporter ATP-binding protein [Pseudomonas sp. Marseille-QA0332]